MSPGINQILAEHVQGWGNTLYSEICKLISSIWNKNELPEQWKESVIVFIRRTVIQTCAFWGISWLPPTHRVVCNILLSRLIPYVDVEVIGNHQCRCWHNYFSYILCWFCMLEKEQEYKVSQGYAMIQVVSCQPLTAEAWVSPCWICGRQTGSGTGFSPRSSVFSCQHHSTMAVHAHISPRGWTILLLVATVHRRHLTPLMWTTWARCPM
jgi:hypothetical protein